jgi:hypothetical protein
MVRSTRHYNHNENPTSQFRKWSGGTNGPHVAGNCDKSSRPRRNVGHVLGLRSQGRCIQAQRIAKGKVRSFCYASRNCFGKPVPVSHFHAFGQYGYMTNTSKDRNPLRPRAILCRYLQAVNEHKYKVVQLHTNRVVTCRPEEFSPVPRPAPAPSEPPHYSDAVQVHAESSTAERKSHPAMPISEKPASSVYASSRADTFRAGARRHCPKQRPHYAPKQMMRALAMLLVISYQVSSVSCSSTAAAPPLYSPRHLNDALKQPDAAEWAVADDACIDGNFILNAWTACEPPQEVQLAQPIWDLRQRRKLTVHVTSDLSDALREETL